MHLRAFVAVFVSLLIADMCAARNIFAAPAMGDLRPTRIDSFQRVEDTCWWWSTRWQYGWRGYGWYPCWDWTKPQPTVIAPEEVPPGALSPSTCVQSWRDSAGNVHSRRVC